jgi:hypothetical protein
MPFADDKQPTDGTGSILALLAPTLGFIVWAGHFLFVYCLTAIACAMGWSPGAMRWTLIAQAAATVLALGSIGVHALFAARLPAGVADRTFMMRLTLGCDAIAAFGVAMMLGPILLTPGCA